MTDPIDSNQLLPDRLHGIVEAFLDGEAVDPAMLRAALADEAARDHFVDLLVIRRAMSGMDALTMSAGHGFHGNPRRTRWLAAIAAAAFISVTLGYVAGQRVVASTAMPSTVEATVIVDRGSAAPAPTRSIPLRPGINWTDRSGGR